MTSDDMKVSKGLEFPVMALPGVGHMPAKGEEEQEAARVFYVAATRATQRLVIGVGGDGGFGTRISENHHTQGSLIQVLHTLTYKLKMDRVQQLSYEKDFRIIFLEAKGDGFQRLFEKLMAKAHPNDFMACRPWGNVGDRKNDGYQPSARTLFQSYAPNELSAAEAIKKINEDFEGAKEYWEEYFDEWTFVHNAPDGRLGPHVIEALAKIAQENPKIKIGHCGWEEMLAKFRQLNLQDLESWFGPSLTMEANVNLGYGDLMAVLTHISVAPAPATSEVKDVSRGKIEANLLSQVVADFLKIGMQKSPLVMQFFDNWKNPVYGEQIASAFKNQYAFLRDASPALHPDEIFGQLETWAGGVVNTTPTHKAAVLAVMAYLFDKCEIFEDAQGVRST